MPFRFYVLMGVIGLGLLAGALWDGREKARLIQAGFPEILSEPGLVQASVSRGRHLFQANCQTCHQSDARGDAGHGVPDLTDGVWLHGEGTPQEIERLISHGIRAHDPRGAGSLAYMPAYGRETPYGPYPIEPLTPAQISLMADYILSLSGKMPADSSATVMAREIYDQSAGCSDCHGADARGDSAIGAPDLTQGKRLWGDGGRQSLIISISEGRAGACPAFRRRLNAVQIRDLTLYLHSLNPASPARPGMGQ